MDNDTMYFSLNCRNIFDNSINHNLKLAYENILLEDRKNYIIDTVILRDSMGGIYRIRELATDNGGLLYLLDDNADIWQYDYRRNQKELVVRHEEASFTNEAKLAYSGGVLYISDLKADSKITAFSINDSRILWTMGEIGDKPLFPLDIAADGNNNLYVLVPLDLVKASGEDYEVQEGGRLGVLKLNSSSELVSIYECEALKLKTGTKAAYLKGAAFLEVSGSGDLFILNTQTKEVFIFNREGELLNCFNAEEPAFPSDLAYGSNDMLFISDLQSLENRTHYSSPIYRFDREGRPSGRITGIMAGISRIIPDKGNNIYALDNEGNAITVFKLKKQMKESSIYKLPHGTLITFSLDSTAAETEWHKCVLDAVIPEDTQLRISYFAREEREALLDNKKVDIDEYLKDNTISFGQKLAALEAYWSKPQINPKDSLIHGAKGRYIWFKIEFAGSRENTPALSRLRVYYPRKSYLRYLPLVYQEDSSSRDFLERYLSMFETLYDDLDEKISHVSKYFDIDYVSGPFLRWLSTWVEVAAGEEWEDDKLRKFARNAVDIYKRRGTRSSLEKIIEIYTGEKPIIIESFALRKMTKEPHMKELVSRLYGVEHNSFCVLIRSQAVKNVQQRLEIQRIIDSEKPAFTEAKLIILQPHIRLDMHSYLGLNSYLSEISLLHLNDKAAVSAEVTVIDSVRTVK